MGATHGHLTGMSPRAGPGPNRSVHVGRLLVGLIVIGVGALFLLDAAEVLDAGDAFAHWWPAIVVAIGVSRLIERPRSVVGPLVVIAAGVTLLLVTTGVVEGDVWSYLWPVALITLGSVAVIRWAGAGSLPRSDDDSVVVTTAFFGGPTLSSTSQEFAGASLTAVFGGVVLDLRRARPAVDGARITATAAFGGIDIIIPHGWRVSVSGTPLFGGVEDRTRRDTDVPADGPLLRVDAVAIFGGVEIKHEP